MKAKKALKRLDHVDDLLSSVLVQYHAKNERLRELLHSAVASVSLAKKAITMSFSAAKTKPARTQPEETRERHVERSSPKRVSAAAKTTPSVVKRTFAAKMAHDRVPTSRLPAKRVRPASKDKMPVRRKLGTTVESSAPFAAAEPGQAPVEASAIPERSSMAVAASKEQLQ